MRAGSVLLEPEIAHKQRVQGVQFTLENFEDLNISLFRECCCCARFIDEQWPDDVSGRDSFSQYLGECSSLVATSLGLKVSQKYAKLMNKGIKEDFKDSLTLKNCFAFQFVFLPIFP